MRHTCYINYVAMKLRELKKDVADAAKRALANLWSIYHSTYALSKRYRWVLAIAWFLLLFAASLNYVEARIWWFLLGILPFAWLAVGAAMSRQGKQSTILNLVLSIFASLAASLVANYIYPSQSELPHLVTLYSQQVNNKVDDVSSKIDRLAVEMRQRGIDPAEIKEKMDLLYKECHYNLAGCASERLRKWREVGRITAGEKEILNKTVDLLLSYGDQIAKEAEKLRKEGNDDYAQFLESLAKLLAQGDAGGIRELAERRIQERREKSIRELRAAIEATKSLLSFEDTNDLYRQLLEFEPTYENYMEYANYLHQYRPYEKLSLEPYRRALESARNNAAKRAAALNNMAVALSDLGRREEALKAAEEATQNYRELAAKNPDAFLPYLATSLNNLGRDLSDLGRREEALKATEEAVKIRRELAAKNPDAFLPDLAGSLNNLGNMLSELGRREEALKATEEAVRSLTPHFLQYPEAFGGWMQVMVVNYLKRALELGRKPESDLLCPLLQQADALLAELRDLITPLCKARDSLE